MVPVWLLISGTVASVDFVSANSGSCILTSINLTVGFFNPDNYNQKAAIKQDTSVSDLAWGSL